MTMQNDPRALAIAYIEAVGNKQFDRVADLLHPDIDFVTTGRTLQGHGPVMDALRRLAPIIERNTVRQTIVDGNDVGVIYDFVTDTPAGAVPTVEWVTVDDGKIRTSRLIFDKTNWPSAVAELQRRLAHAA